MEMVARHVGPPAKSSNLIAATLHQFFTMSFFGHVKKSELLRHFITPFRQHNRKKAASILASII